MLNDIEQNDWLKPRTKCLKGGEQLFKIVWYLQGASPTMYKPGKMPESRILKVCHLGWPHHSDAPESGRPLFVRHLRGIRVRIALLIVLITLGTFLVGWGVRYHERHGSISSLIENAHITNKTPAVFQRLSLIPRAKRSVEQQEEELEILVPKDEEVTIKMIHPPYMQFLYQMMRWV